MLTQCDCALSIKSDASASQRGLVFQLISYYTRYWWNFDKDLGTHQTPTRFPLRAILQLRCPVTIVYLLEILLSPLHPELYTVIQSSIIRNSQCSSVFVCWFYSLSPLAVSLFVISLALGTRVDSVYVYPRLYPQSRVLPAILLCGFLFNFTFCSFVCTSHLP